MPLIKYEFKYCERCGSLRLRRVESGAPYYCQACAQLLSRIILLPRQGLVRNQHGRSPQTEIQPNPGCGNRAVLSPGRVQ